MTHPRSAFGAPPQGGAPSGPAKPVPRRPLGARQPRRALHGVLLLDKPIGWTSNDALQKVKGMLRAEKGGHTGTLDPLATGLLPLCFGAATKFSQVSLDADKRYTATVKLGVKTSTGDREGQVLQTRPVAVTRAAIEAACAAFTGDIQQLPPMHSALKHEGKALYDYARAGIEIERPKRAVTIHHIDILDWHDDELVLDVSCSKGTYIRTLAEDIGEALGCGAHLSALRRTGSGTLTVTDTITIEALQALSEAEREALVHPADVLVSAWPEVRLPDDEAGRFLCGLRRRVALADASAVRVYRYGRVPEEPGAAPSSTFTRAFLGTAHIQAGELIADRLLSPIEIQEVS